MSTQEVRTLTNAEDARGLLRSFVEERYPDGSHRRLEDGELLPGMSGAWVLEHDGGFALIRVPDTEQTLLSIRAGVAIAIPRSDELAYYVACHNKQIMAGRAFLEYGDELALVILEEIVWGRALSWDFEPSLSDMLARFESVIRQAGEMRSTILERFGGRPFREQEWMHMVL